MLAGRNDRFHGYLGANLERHHDTMLEDAFGNRSESIAARELVSDFRYRRKRPLDVARERREILAALQEKAAFFRQVGKRILQTVKHLGQKSRSELHRKEFSRKMDLVAGFKSRSILEDLEFRIVSANTDDFAFQFHARRKSCKTDFVLRDSAIKCDTDQVSVHTDNFTDTSHLKRDLRSFLLCRRIVIINHFKNRGISRLGRNPRPAFANFELDGKRIEIFQAPFLGSKLFDKPETGFVQIFFAFKRICLGIGIRHHFGKRNIVAAEGTLRKTHILSPGSGASMPQDIL